MNRKEDQGKFLDDDDLKLKKEVVPCDDGPNLDDFESSNFDIANKQFDLGVPNPVVNYFGWFQLFLGVILSRKCPPQKMFM